MDISGIDADGHLLSLVTTEDAGSEEDGDSRVMAFSFRLCLTAVPENRLPMPAPDHYDPARFEIIRRYIKAGGKSYGFDLYPLPSGKVDGNNSIARQFSLGLVGGGNTWHTADEEERQSIWEAHKQYTLEFFHFMTTDRAVPVGIRNRWKFGLCRDEFAENDHFPPAPSSVNPAGCKGSTC